MPWNHANLVASWNDGSFLRTPFRCLKLQVDQISLSEWSSPSNVSVIQNNAVFICIPHAQLICGTSTYMNKNNEVS